MKPVIIGTRNELEHFIHWILLFLKIYPHFKNHTGKG